VELITDPQHGESRVLLLGGLKVGEENGRSLLATLVDDPELGLEARNILKLKR